MFFSLTSFAPLVMNDLATNNLEKSLILERQRHSGRPPSSTWDFDKPRQAMAEGRAPGADAALATTGVAGPSEQAKQPVGTVFPGPAMAGMSKTRQGDRQRIRPSAVVSAANLPGK